MPTTAAQFLIARDAAKTAYSDAVDALITAAIDLAALDQVLSTDAIRAKLTGTDSHAHPRGFNGDYIAALGAGLRHGEAKPTTSNDIPGQIRAAVAAKIADWTGA